MINTYKKPEILAPCGSYDIMIAAINAGADACYFGGNKFGARAYATNFDLETSLKAIDYAHIHGTSLYLTVNTLFKDNEIEGLYDYILPYYEAGLDAVIVQDLGVFKYIKEMFPDMSIHCSTQMNITSKYAAKGMKELGASRIVTAREMSLEEIADIKRELDIEIESFVHGAMCYSYSGRCLMSSLAGGRSGNRGRCAQPCRKCYDGQYILSMKDMCTLTDVPKLIEAGIDSLKIEGRMKNEYYVASAVDAYKQITEDYIYGCYSQKKAEELKFKLANIYNRGGFCGGYYFMHNGPDMISQERPNNQGVKLGKVTFAKDGEVGIKLYTDLYKQDVLELRLKDGSIIEITSGIEAMANKEVSLKCPKTKLVQIGQIALRTRCNHIIDNIDNELVGKLPKYDLYGEFTAQVGEPIRLTVGRNINNDYVQATVEGDMVQEARDREANVSDIKAKLSQLGNTCYNFTEIVMKVDNNSFVPASAIKSLRRDAISALEEEICSSYKRKVKFKYFEDKPRRIYANNQNKCHELTDNVSVVPEIVMEVSSFEQLKEVVDASLADGIYMSLSLFKSCLKDGIIDKLNNKGVRIYLKTPNIVGNFFDICEYLQYPNISGIYIRNIDGLFAYISYVNNSEIKLEHMQVICGDGVYAYNNMSRAFIRELVQNVVFELPRELNKKELTYIEGYNNQLVVYEHQPVMLSAQCVVKNKLGCNKSNSLVKLKDDKKNVFIAKAVCEECCNVIYNGVPYMILEQLNSELISGMGINSIRFNFTIEDREKVRDILDIVKQFKDKNGLTHNSKNSNHIYTSGHFNRGVE